MNRSRCHQRPLKRHVSVRSVVSAAGRYGLGHSASVAATMATASSAVGAGETEWKFEEAGTPDKLVSRAGRPGIAHCEWARISCS
jgi:hypothetical protein